MSDRWYSAAVDLPAGYSWRVTDSTGKSHTHGADDGRVGWKRHAVADNGEAERAACGLVPAAGWGIDIFETDMDICSKCAVKLGACRKCKGHGSVLRETSPRSSITVTCDACDGKGREPDPGPPGSPEWLKWWASKVSMTTARRWCAALEAGRSPWRDVGIGPNGVDGDPGLVAMRDALRAKIDAFDG